MNIALRPLLASVAVAFFLSGCASTPGTDAAKATPQYGVLVQNGKLTEEGELRRDLGLEHSTAGRHAAAYAQWLPLAEQGHSASQFNLGLMLRDGLGVPADAAKSLEWTRKAAAANYPDAYLALGVRHANGTGVTKDPAEALRLWRQGAALGDANSAFYAGQALFFGLDVPRDGPGGLKLLLQAAQADTPSVRAQSILGMIYLTGEDGVARDYAKARQWLSLAAAGEESQAQHHLGVMYQFGRGGPADVRKAVAWYERAARQGNPASLNNLATFYKNGKVLPKDVKKAREYFERAHEGGNLDATVNLGDMLFLGRAAEAERDKAVALYKQAAEAAHAPGQCRYARALRHGEGVAASAAEAALWAGKAKAAKQACDTRLPLATFLK
ncbi:tetratricopeptide repeat protein [Massilia pseudoviolaceinigra]|uniref:tetratricopeptide repeat protein n=1 Tax=Massilia pseudoviolaceinigra TaxID=3057165 RepID=UPI002796BA18|nr:tetratricopeptide repeat protein [Massilia sp. CCM 9206]MDQ1920201.1 tetratricopeptide repeat protein [Massilia sp. CCM 9206]